MSYIKLKNLESPTQIISMESCMKMTSKKAILELTRLDRSRISFIDLSVKSSVICAHSLSAFSYKLKSNIWKIVMEHGCKQHMTKLLFFPFWKWHVTVFSISMSMYIFIITAQDRTMERYIMISNQMLHFMWENCLVIIVSKNTKSMWSEYEY